MKILVISDSHGYDENVMRALEEEQPIDALIHLGDSQGSADEIRYLADCESYMVAGNCDFFSGLPEMAVAEIAGHRIMMTHGHHHSVNSGTKYLVYEARENGCDIALYGHTHIPEIDSSDPDVLVMNPGSISLPRQSGRQPSYLVIEVGEDGVLQPELKFFEKNKKKR